MRGSKLKLREETGLSSFVARSEKHPEVSRGLEMIQADPVQRKLVCDGRVCPGAPIWMIQMKNAFLSAAQFSTCLLAGECLSEATFCEKVGPESLQGLGFLFLLTSGFGSYVSEPQSYESWFIWTCMSFT